MTSIALYGTLAERGNLKKVRNGEKYGGLCDKGSRANGYDVGLPMPKECVRSTYLSPNCFKRERWMLAW